MSCSYSLSSSNSDKARVERILRQAEGIREPSWSPTNDPFYYNPAKEPNMEVTQPLKRQRTDTYEPVKARTTTSQIPPKNPPTEKTKNGKAETTKVSRPLHEQTDEEKTPPINKEPVPKERVIEIVVLSDKNSC